MQRLVDAGELTEEEAEQSERRNIILQALGPDPRVKVDLTHQPLRRGDTLVICSDGLSALVRREEIGELLRRIPDLASACSALIDLANGRGGPDNITVVLARFEGEGLDEARGTGEVGYQEYPLPEGTMPTLERETPGAPLPPSPPPAVDASSAEVAAEPRPEPTAPRRAFRVPLGAVVGLIAAGLLLLVARCSAGAGP
jgi:protein phosphatase